jgi:ammonium transporter, Amt family
MNKFWRIPFILLVLASLLALAMPNYDAPSLEMEGVDKADMAWMLTSTCLVLLMTPGLAFFYGGMVSTKNVISTMLQSFISMGLMSLLWVFVGFSLAFGDSIGGIIGDPRTYFMFQGVSATKAMDGLTIPLMLFAFFQLKFAIITPALITGSFAERIRFSGYLLFITLFSLIIYCPLAHMTWHAEGYFFKHGVLDFAGGTVVHISAGCAALAGAIFLKRRKHDVHVPANIPFVILGTGLLWFGWFGFNAGSALGVNGVAINAFATTNTASAAAALAWIFFDAIQGRKISALGACIGAVVGLVAITPAAGYVGIPASIFIGVFASLVSNIMVNWKNKTGIDDTLDVFPCHGVGGIVGMILTPLFAFKEKGGLLATGDWTLMNAHLKDLVIVLVFAFGGSYLLFWLVNKIIPLRVTAENEELGLDESQHGERLTISL